MKVYLGKYVYPITTYDIVSKIIVITFGIIYARKITTNF